MSSYWGQKRRATSGSRTIVCLRLYAYGIVHDVHVYVCSFWSRLHSFYFVQLMFWVKRIAIRRPFNTQVNVCVHASTVVVILRDCTLCYANRYVMAFGKRWFSFWTLVRTLPHVGSQGTVARMAFIRCWRRHVLSGCGQKLWSYRMHGHSDKNKIESSRNMAS